MTNDKGTGNTMTYKGMQICTTVRHYCTLRRLIMWPQNVGASKFRTNILLHCSYLHTNTLEKRLQFLQKLSITERIPSYELLAILPLGTTPKMMLTHTHTHTHTHKTSKYSIIQNRQSGKNTLSLYSNYTVTFPCNRILYSNL